MKARRQILVEQREQLLVKMAEIQETLDLLNNKIEEYENVIMNSEEAFIIVEDQIAW